MSLVTKTGSRHAEKWTRSSPWDGVAFATALEPKERNFFQAFMAAAPRHPILRQALDIMLSYYKGTHKLHGRGSQYTRGLPSST